MKATVIEVFVCSSGQISPCPTNRRSTKISVDSFSVTSVFIRFLSLWCNFCGYLLFSDSHVFPNPEQSLNSILLPCFNLHVFVQSLSPSDIKK